MDTKEKGLNRAGRTAAGIIFAIMIMTAWILSYISGGETAASYFSCAVMAVGSWIFFTKKNPYPGLASSLFSVALMVRAYRLAMPVADTVLPMLCFMATMPVWANAVLCLADDAETVGKHAEYENAASVAQGIASCAACAAIVAGQSDMAAATAVAVVLAASVPACWTGRKNALTGCTSLAASLVLLARYGTGHPGVAICAACAMAFAVAGFLRMRKTHTPPEKARWLRKMEAEKEAEEERQRRGAKKQEREAARKKMESVYYGSYYYKVTGLPFDGMLDRGEYGEFITSAAIEKETDANRPGSPFRMLCGVYVPTPSGVPTEVDIITIGPYGVRCMEVKNGRGTYVISGTGAGDAVEILPDGARKTDIGNPLAQNFGHMRALAWYLRKNRMYRAADNLAGYVVFGPDVTGFRFLCGTEEEQNGRTMKQGYCHAGDAGKAVLGKKNPGRPVVLGREDVEGVYRLLKPHENNEEEMRMHRERHNY